MVMVCLLVGNYEENRTDIYVFVMGSVPLG
jgi:hypothetical protein